ncbi:DUF4190 domain-containing protein [Dyella jiangningensis]|uniref:DUF4190 domain-containing protein n=1 Tax=Dyella jiangningensis TaxID=1379159 RepID=UPI00240F2656|nr:DUF4190 domain-containing protein [Dyella jiangningensis]MDG2537605.1 DUF4190 domain-containing protein [Dyella jiangningensis]
MSYQTSSYRSTNSLAVISLIFGICCWFVLPLIGAIVAVVCGHLARAEIRRAEPGTVEGDGLAIAGLVLGYVHLALALLAIVFVVAFLLLGFGIGLHSLHW